MIVGEIPYAWVAWIGRLDAEHLLAVKAEMAERGADPTDKGAVLQCSKDVAFAVAANGPKSRFQRRPK